MTSNKEWTIEEKQVVTIWINRELTVKAETKEEARNLYKAGKATLVKEEETERQTVTLPSISERKDNDK